MTRPRYEMGSPSSQVKSNAVRIWEIVKSLSIFEELGIWVQGVVVFTNKDVRLNIDNPTVPILKLNEVTDYITTKESSNHFSSQELELISKKILKQLHACMHA